MFVKKPPTQPFESARGRLEVSTLTYSIHECGGAYNVVARPLASGASGRITQRCEVGIDPVACAYFPAQAVGEAIYP